MENTISAISVGRLPRLVPFGFGDDAGRIDARQRLLQVKENDQPGRQFDYSQQIFRVGGGDYRRGRLAGKASYSRVPENWECLHVDSLTR